MKLVPANISEEEFPGYEAALAKALEFQKQRRQKEQEEAEAEAEASYTRAFLLGHRKRRGPSLQMVKFEADEDVFFEVGTRILSDSDYREIGLWMGSRGYTLFPTVDIESQNTFYAALFLVGLTEAHDETQRRFGSFRECEEWLTEDGLAEVVSTLRYILVERNPFVKKNLPAEIRPLPLAV